MAGLVGVHGGGRGGGSTIVGDIMHPIDTFLRTNLITAKAVARHMRHAGRGPS